MSICNFYKLKNKNINKKKILNQEILERDKYIQVVLKNKKNYINIPYLSNFNE